MAGRTTLLARGRTCSSSSRPQLGGRLPRRTDLSCPDIARSDASAGSCAQHAFHASRLSAPHACGDEAIHHDNGLDRDYDMDVSLYFLHHEPNLADNGNKSSVVPNVYVTEAAVRRTRSSAPLPIRRCGAASRRASRAREASVGRTASSDKQRRQIEGKWRTISAPCSAIRLFWSLNLLMVSYMHECTTMPTQYES